MSRVLPFTLAAAALVWAAAILAAPRLPPAAGASAYLAGSIVCHQQSERSFHVGGAQLPVCARCTGLYLGAVLGLAAWAVAGRGRSTTVRAWRRALLAAAAPTAASWLVAVIGVWDPGNAVRAALAAPLGIVVGAALAAVAGRELR